MRQSCPRPMKVRETTEKMGPGLLPAEDTVPQGHGGAHHEPPATIPRTTAESHAAPPRNGPRAAPARAGAGAAPLAGLGTGGVGAGPTRDGRTRGAVAPAGAATPARERLREAVAPRCLAAAATTRQGGKRVQRLGQALWGRRWRPVADKSPATRRRWPWTGVGAESLVKTSGQPLGLVGTWWSGPEPRGRLGLAGLRRLVGLGDGKRVVAVDVVGRRPAPTGPGRPCRDQRPWWQVRRDRTWTALRRRCRPGPAPLVVAESGFGDATWLPPVTTHPQGPWRVEGKRASVFTRSAGCRVNG
jgi:hypothetical protein